MKSWRRFPFLLLLSVNANAVSNMEYVEICKAKNDCKKFSRLVMGTDHLVQADWQGKGELAKTEKEVFTILDEALRNGINTFDTSPIYVGGVEYILGKWIKARTEQVKRDSFYLNPGLNPDRKIYVISKGGFPFDLSWSKKLPTGTHSQQLKSELRKQGILTQNIANEDGSFNLQNVPAGTYASRLYGRTNVITDRVKDEIKHTLNNLNGEIASYLMHRDDGDYIGFDEVKRKQTPVSKIMNALSEKSLVKDYWMVGWSNWQTARVDKSVALATEQPQLIQPIMNSPYFSLFEMSKRSIHAGGVQVRHHEMNDVNFQKGIKIMPYSPLGGFSIFDKPEPKWENGKKAAKEKYDQGDAYWKNVYHAIFTPKNKSRYKRLVSFTKSFNQKNNSHYTIDQLANAYALAHKRVDMLAIGPVTIDQLQRTLNSLKISKYLSKADLDYLYSGK